MINAMEPLNLLSGIEALGNTLDGWTLDHTSGFTEDRQFRHKVLFDRAFGAVPVVHIGITGFDISNHDSARLTATVAGISLDGFEIVLSTWLNSRIWRVDVSWIAIGR
jgi:hypothetical protein